MLCKERNAPAGTGARERFADERCEHDHYTIPPEVLERFRREVAEFKCDVCGHYARYHKISDYVSCPTCGIDCTPDQYKALRDHGTIPPGTDLGRLLGLRIGREARAVPCPVAPDDQPHDLYIDQSSGVWSCYRCGLHGTRHGGDRIVDLVNRLADLEAENRALRAWSDAEEVAA